MTLVSTRSCLFHSTVHSDVLGFMMGCRDIQSRTHVQTHTRTDRLLYRLYTDRLLYRLYTDKVFGQNILCTNCEKLTFVSDTVQLMHRYIDISCISERTYTLCTLKVYTVKTPVPYCTCRNVS